MKKIFHLSVSLFFAMILLCSCSDDKNVGPLIYTYDFMNGIQGWEGNFADYPVGDDEFYELAFEHSRLPVPLDENEGALKITGNNHSDDLFMYIMKNIDGLDANTTYDISIEIEFATNGPDGMFGVGGSPGESVYMKAGVTAIKPERNVDEQNWYRINIDKANQAQSGNDMIVLGDFSNDTETENYVLKTITNSTVFTVSSNASGELWLIVGSDSGFESTTTVYYNQITFEFNKHFEL